MAASPQYRLHLAEFDTTTLDPDTVGAAHRWIPRCRATLAAQRKAQPVLIERRTTRTRPSPRPRKVAQVLVDTASDLRRGVDASIVARRLDNLAADIDPSITTGLAS